MKIALKFRILNGLKYSNSQVNISLSFPQVIASIQNDSFIKNLHLQQCFNLIK